MTKAKQIKEFAARIEHIEEEKRTLAEDLKAIYEDAEAAGFNKLALRKALGHLKLDSYTRHKVDQYVLDLGGEPKPLVEEVADALKDGGVEVVEEPKKRRKRKGEDEGIVSPFV
jgi:uncharacterized protein (UPF0335 family)